MFLVELDGRVVRGYIFSDEADARRLAEAIGGEVVSATVNPALVYEESAEKVFGVNFSGEFISSVEALPMVLDGMAVRLPVYLDGSDFLSSGGKEAWIYVRAASEDDARTLAVARRAAMLAEQVARTREAVAALAERLSTEDRGEVVVLLDDGRKASAVKFAREVLACGLREAAEIVNYLGEQREVEVLALPEGAWGSTCGVCGCTDWGHAPACPGDPK